MCFYIVCKSGFYPSPKTPPIFVQFPFKESKKIRVVSLFKSKIFGHKKANIFYKTYPPFCVHKKKPKSPPILHFSVFCVGEFYAKKNPTFFPKKPYFLPKKNQKNRGAFRPPSLTFYVLKWCKCILCPFPLVSFSVQNRKKWKGT